MLKKVNVKHKVVVVLVRTQEDLEKCDALIIPGGGAIFVVQTVIKSESYNANLGFLCRIYNYCSTGEACRIIRASSRVCVSKACLGDVCRRNPAFQRCVKYKERRTRGTGRGIYHHRKEWLGITGRYFICIVCFWCYSFILCIGRIVRGSTGC